MEDFEAHPYSSEFRLIIGLAINKASAEGMPVFEVVLAMAFILGGLSAAAEKEGFPKDAFDMALKMGVEGGADSFKGFQVTGTVQ